VVVRQQFNLWIDAAQGIQTHDTILQQQNILVSSLDLLFETFSLMQMQEGIIFP
jgi:hypothetical protein